MKRIGFIIASFLLTSQAFAAWHTCRPTQVAVFANRIHIRCAAAAPGGISYFAIRSTSSSKDFVNRMQSLGTTAQIAGKSLNLQYNPSAIGQSWGCLKKDCRPLNSAIMY